MGAAENYASSRAGDVSRPLSRSRHHVRELFDGFAQRAGTIVEHWLAEHPPIAKLGRLPTLTEVADYAAFAASDRAAR